MLTKLAAALHSKVAIAVLGVILVGGGGSAVAVAATTGHLTTLGIHLNSTAGSDSAKSTTTPDSHANTVGVEGLLTACDATANQISVTDSANKVWVFTVSATTTYNGDANTSQQGASSAQGDNSANAGSASDGGASTVHTAITLTELCTFVNTRDVQVQATPDGANYDAWKVTLQGPGTSNSNGDSSSSNGSGSSSNGNSNAPAAKAFEGTVTAVSSSSFTLLSKGTSYQVTVTSTTVLQGASAVDAITLNSHAAVTGTLSGSTIAATTVVVSAPDSSGN